MSREPHGHDFETAISLNSARRRAVARDLDNHPAPPASMYFRELAGDGVRRVRHARRRFRGLAWWIDLGCVLWLLAGAWAILGGLIVACQLLWSQVIV